MATNIQLNLFGERDFAASFQSLMRMIPATESEYATHNIHPYPAKFLPHFPHLFIEQYTKPGDLVVDPMCGSGTTLVEACLLNRKAYGSDIDPIAALISRVSVTPLVDDEIREYEKRLFSELEMLFSQVMADEVELPSEQDFPNSELWFRPDVLRELLLIRNEILQLESSSELRDFGLLCLSSIVRPVSNADPRDIFPERDQNNPVRERKDTLAELKRAFYQNRIRVTDFSNRVHKERLAQAHHGDARSIGIADNRADLVFTSPPYAYAMDYARVHQLSTLLFVMDNKAFREHRRRYIGTDRISVSESLDDFRGFEFAETELREIHSEHKKLGVILYSYFRDMHDVTQECQRVLKPGAHLVYVVGNSTVRGTHFRTDEVFVGICKGLGFEVTDVLNRPYFAYRMSRKRNTQSNTIKADVFIVARKP